MCTPRTVVEEVAGDAETEMEGLASAVEGWEEAAEADVETEVVLEGATEIRTGCWKDTRCHRPTGWCPPSSADTTVLRCAKLPCKRE